MTGRMSTTPACGLPVPFTVESLSPHRVLTVDADDRLIGGAAQPRSKYRHDGSATAGDFAAMILDNLKASGVQQAHKEDRISFTALTGWPGRYIGAEGRFMEGNKDRRAGILIGPRVRDSITSGPRCCRARGR